MERHFHGVKLGLDVRISTSMRPRSSNHDFTETFFETFTKWFENDGSNEISS